MDWYEDTQTNLWAFPRGMKRNGGVGDKSIEWTSKYGSLVGDIYAAASCDGINDVGLVGNALYLAESDYGDPNQSDKPQISIGAWLQYILDNYSTVAEAVEGFREQPFAIVAPVLPGDKPSTGHISISDSSGDNAIFEYIEGELIIHHDHKYSVMTNQPPYDQQLAINTYWDTVGGLNMLPGTHRASDRFARVSWNLNAAQQPEALKKVDSKEMAAGVILSIMRHMSVPLTLADPEKPNISATAWRVVSDIKNKIFYFDYSYRPSVFWVDLKKLNLKEGAPSQKLEAYNMTGLTGEVSDKFVPHEPFPWLSEENKSRCAS